MKLFFFLAFVAAASGCTKASKDAVTPETAQIVTIERLEQQTERYDCSGNLSSNRVETINSVSKIFLVSPNSKENIWSFSARNVTTSSSGGGLSGTNGRFTLDLAPTVFNMKAEEGINEIRYSFSYCHEQVKNPVNNNIECAHTPSVDESGVMFIRINYSVRNVEGVRVIKPSTESCKE